MQNIGIFYGSSTGNTEAAAEQLQKEFGADNARIFDVSDVKSSDLEGYSNLIFGSSTWGIGDLQDDFEGFLPEISNANLAGKKVAVFGLGDQFSYPDSFVNGIGEIYELLEDKGCEIIGHTSTDGYEYDETKAEKDGQLVGLVLDEENQSDLTSVRITNWVQELKNQFS